MPSELVKIVVFSLIVYTTAEEKNWVLLVAGSNGYENYRHQADVCHAYQIIHKHGIPDEQIVVMMYDDIANNEENPVRGNIINQPNGSNVYINVPKDYTGKDVTPEVFLKVLSGDADGVEKILGRKGKVIKSGPKDHLFINFVDHGAPGLLAFPDDMLYATDLEKTIIAMHKKKRYGKMVFYVEACESGSMFENILPKDINVFVTTAANSEESSYACYFDESRQTYLGDVYSVNWMQDSDKENLDTETLKKQFDITRNETNTSHVMEYGDLTMSKLPVAVFQGTKKDLNASDYYVFTDPLIDAVRSEKVKLSILQHKFHNAKSPQEKEVAATKLNSLLNLYSKTDDLFQSIVAVVTKDQENGYKNLLYLRMAISKWQCYQKAVEALMFVCPGMKLPQNDYALRHLYLLVNLCEKGYSSQAVRAGIAVAAYFNPKFCLQE